MSSSPVSLLQLPSELLRLVWDKLQNPIPRWISATLPATASARDQHALRSTCRQLRDATTPFINTVLVVTNYSNWAVDDIQTWSETLEDSLAQVAAFPSGATPMALRWSYEERRSDGHEAALPELLPEFFAEAGGRLGSVTSVTLTGQLALGYGEFSSLVDACPRLERLFVEHVPLLARGLAPLARLAGLRALSLHFVEPLDDDDGTAAARVYAPVSLLVGLTQLQTLGATVDILLPHLSGLTSLRALQIRHTCRLKGDSSAFHHLGPLTQLTSLTVQTSGPVFIISSLALPASLVRLRLPGITLQTAAIKVIASLPRLSDLTAGAMTTDVDLSGLASSYTAMTLGDCPSPLQLTCLPLRSVQRMSISAQHGSKVAWSLDAADPESTNATLRSACHILAQTMSSHDGQLRLRLNWTTDVPFSSSSCSSSAPALSALAPLQPLQRSLSLILGDNWGDVSGQHIDQLAAHLPGLAALHVADACKPGFASLAAAVGTTMPQLRCLRIGERDTGKLSRASQDALRELAAVRACNGLPLRVEVFETCMSRRQLDRCSATVDRFRSSARGTTCPVSFCLFDGS